MPLRFNDPIIDISTPLKNGALIWPGSTGVQVSWTLRVEKGEPSNLTRLDADVHIGTHIEGGLHSFAEGIAADKIPLENFIGPAEVIYLPDVEIISAEVLSGVQLSNNTTRVLFKTGNSDLWRRGEQQFQKDFVGLTADGAQYLVECGVRLVGNDYLSVAKFTDGPAVHGILLKAGVAIIEGLNLDNVKPGVYQLVCLPILLPGREAAPARAVLLPLL